MKRLSHYLRSLLLITALGLISLQGYSQTCSITTSTSSGSNQGCLPFTVGFTVNTPSGKTVSSYLWQYGDPGGNKSTQASPSFQYRTRGTFYPTVKVTFSDGTTCDVTDTIVVYGLPNPVIVLPTQTIECFKGNVFHFTQNSTPSPDNNPIVKYYWIFGDGDTSSAQSPSHSYQTDGVYTISLTVTDSKGCFAVEDLTASIRVLKDIKPTFTASGYNGCDSTVYTFTNTTDTNGMWLKSWKWDFGNGVTDSVDWTNIQQVYKTPGVSYYPKLLIKNALNCTGSYTDPAPITVTGTNTHIWPQHDTICWSTAKKQGDNFSALAINSAYFWYFDFGDPASGKNNVILDPPSNTIPEREVRATDTITLTKIGTTGSKVSVYEGTTLLGTYTTLSTDTTIAQVAQEIANAINHSSGSNGGYSAFANPLYPLVKAKGGAITISAPKGMGINGDTLKLSISTSGGMVIKSFGQFVGGIDAGSSSVWVGSHKFVGGPGNYCVTITASINCGGVLKTVTSQVVVYIPGPAASVTYGAPPVMNAYYGVKKRSLADFYSRQKTGSVCAHTDTIQYSYFKKTGKTDIIKLYQYCGDTDAFVKKHTTYNDSFMNDTGCDRVFYHTLVGMSRKPDIDSLTVSYADSQEVGVVWYNNQPIPTGTIYYCSSMVQPTLDSPAGLPVGVTSNIPTGFVDPKTGRVYQDVFPNMYDQAKYSTAKYNALYGTGVLGPADSDVSLCIGPNYVFFTNFTYKYRLYIASDDGGGPGLDPGMCNVNEDPNYPYASDSLQYLWTFNGPGDSNCTSTKRNPNIKCKYSTEVTPYHFYNAKQFQGGGCVSVTLSVWDSVMRCGDTASYLLKMHEPDAWWDTTAYCKMTWEMQQILPAGQAGTPGRPLLGFKLDHVTLPCTGPYVQYYIDFAQTLPSCGGDHFWVEFDSAQDVKKGCTVTTSGGGHYSINQYAWISDPIIEGILNYLWSYPDTAKGCKTLGVIVQNGDCFDTAWYHNYICFSEFTANFKVIDPEGDMYSSAVYGSHESCPSGEGQLPSHIKLAVDDTGMKMITHFSYFVQRHEVDTNYTGFGPQDYYYTLPFWPDSLSSAPEFPAYADSISSVSDTLFFPKDSTVYVLAAAGDTIYIGYPTFYLLGNSYTQVHNSSGIPLDSYTVNTSGLNEIAELNKTGQLTLSPNDPRSREVSLTCKGPTIVYLNTKVTKKVELIMDSAYVDPAGVPCGNTAKHLVPYTVNILNVNDPTEDNHVFPGSAGAKAAREKITHDTVNFYLPYPGFYYITSYATNFTGCTKAGIFKYINGHYAIFTSQDSIVCIGTPVTFHKKVRYFMTGTCPDPLVQDCLDEVDTFWNVANPQLTRKANKDPNWYKVKGEVTYWIFHDPYSTKALDSVQTYLPTVSHTYTHPGIYDVTMVTEDSLGCRIATLRKGFIKVIQLKANFAMVPFDTPKICVPQYITYADSSQLLLTKYSHSVKTVDPVSGDTLVKKYASYLGKKLEIFHKNTYPCPGKPAVSVAYDSVVTDTVNVDSILSYTWNPGDGRVPITKTSSQKVVFEYLTPGQYSIDLKVKSSLCNSELDRIQYLDIIGPQPSFTLQDSIGCVPLKVRINVHNRLGKTYVWLKGDSTTASSSYSEVQADSVVTVTYYKAGTFYLYLNQTDTTWIQELKYHSTCSVVWPDSTNPSQPRFKIIVHPRGPLKITGDTLICPKTQVKFSNVAVDTSYRQFIWNFGNGVIDTFANAGGTDPTGKTVTTIYNSPGYYHVILMAKNTYGCDSSDTFKVHVLPVTANFTVDSTFAEAGIFTFHNTSLNGVKWWWTYGAGTYNAPPNYDQTSEKDSATAVKHDYASELPAPGSGTPPRALPAGIANTSLLGESPTSQPYEDSFKVCLHTINLAGCSADTCKYVNVKRIWEPYNVITPNGDGINDTFKLRIEGSTNYHLLIFNRWGEVVFESTDPNNCWTGKNKNDGTDCPAGTYYYIWKFQLMNLQQNEHTGTVTIVR